MQHKVPQFIEIEDKIFGPFTLKQFSYLGGGFGLAIIVWRLFADSSFVILLVAPVIGFALALAFLKPNGKPFIYLVQNFLYFIIKPKKYFWKNPGTQESKENVLTFKKEGEKLAKKQGTFVQKQVGSDQIKNLAKNLDQ